MQPLLEGMMVLKGADAMEVAAWLMVGVAYVAAAVERRAGRRDGLMGEWNGLATQKVLSWLVRGGQGAAGALEDGVDVCWWV